MMENYSLSDIRAATGDNGMGFGNGGGDMLLILILFLFGFGGNGIGNFGGRGFGEAATAASQNEILLGQQFDRVGAKLDGIGQGLCDGFYALNSSVKDCCCQTQLGMKDLAAGIHAEGEATRALIRENEIQNLRDKVSDLSLGLSQCNQNEFFRAQIQSVKPPCPVPAYLTCSPYQTYNPGYCGGYGCGPQPNI